MITFKDPTGKEVQTLREQKLKANTPNVTAYFMAASTEFGGTIPKDNIKTDFFSKSKNLESQPAVRGRNTGWEIIQQFYPSLPYKWYNTLVPEWYLRILSTFSDRLLPAFVVKRVVDLTWLDEYNRPECYYHLAAGRYTQRNVKIEIRFHQDHQPKDGSVIAWRIERNGVTQVPLQKHYTPTPYYSLFVKRLNNESLQIYWEF